jgi:hypothetical protein
MGTYMIGAGITDEDYTKFKTLIGKYERSKFEPIPNLLSLHEAKIRSGNVVYLRVRLTTKGLIIESCSNNVEAATGIHITDFVGKYVDEIDKSEDFVDPDFLLSELEKGKICTKELKINANIFRVEIWKEAPNLYGEYLTKL